jgi:hypothetical protein
MKSLAFWLAIAMSLCGTSSLLEAQQIYKVVNPDGSVTYTDEPPSNSDAEPMKLPDIIIEPSVPVRQVQGSRSDSGQQQLNQTNAAELPEIEIVSPAEKQVIPPGQRQVTVTGRSSGNLPNGYRLQLLVNGTPQGQSISAMSWNLANPNPGEQHLSIAILDAQGNQVKRSAERIIYVIR